MEETENVAVEPQKPSKSRQFFEVVKLAILAILIVAPIRMFIAQPFIVSGRSMDPTYADGEYLIIDELSYRFTEPKRGEVIIFKYPEDTSKYFIKRIIALPGEKVSIRNGKVSVTETDGTKIFLDEQYVTPKPSDIMLERELENDEFFVLGDNRPQSHDSRYWGALPRENITGRVFMRLLPISHAAFEPGFANYTKEKATNEVK